MGCSSRGTEANGLIYIIKKELLAKREERVPLYTCTCINVQYMYMYMYTYTCVHAVFLSGFYARGGGQTNVCRIIEGA